MNDIQKLICNYVDKNKDIIFDTERYIWAHPETGFKEWETSEYLENVFEKMGYKLSRAGDIPGFYTDIETGKPGPCILVMGELDALICEDHPEAVNGNAHCCGHNAQCAALVGIAAALKEKKVVDSLYGSIRLMAVPAEELIELEFRENLRKKGIIEFFGGKIEFLKRGFMDDVDIAMLFHTGTRKDVDFFSNSGANGCIAKSLIYKGKAAHAGGSPDKGINALYAATLGLQAVNSLRETFKDENHIRVHPIITLGGGAVNSIPSHVTIESFVRGNNPDVINEINSRVNRAFAGAALSMNANLTICDRPGYHPFKNDKNLLEICEKNMKALVGDGGVDISYTDWGMGSTDMGDLSAVMPTVQPKVCGADGIGHGADYSIADPIRACLNSAKVQLFVIAELLGNNACEAKRIITEANLVYSSKEEYLKTIRKLVMDKEAIEYTKDGEAFVQWKK